MTRPLKIIYAGGGSGGHLFPGIALNEYLGGDSLFLCSSRKLDSEVLTRSSVKFEILPKGIDGFRYSLKRIASFNPDLVVGLGGRTSLCCCLAAKTLGRRVIILEQNIVPGRANRLLSFLCARIYSQWSQTRLNLPLAKTKFLCTGSPLRSMKQMEKEEAKARLGLDSRPTLLVLGGSQGARTINNYMLEEARGIQNSFQVIHITGKSEIKIEEVYEKYGVNGLVYEFCDKMDLVYSAADLAFTRAGAIVIQELAMFKIPSILLPFPYAMDNHQYVNASALARGDMAIMIEEKSLRSGQLWKIMLEYLSEKVRFERMGERLHGNFRYDSTELIKSDLFRKGFLNGSPQVSLVMKNNDYE